MIQSLRNMLFAAPLAAATLFPLRAADGRIPIAAVPYAISAPGVYYLTQDLTIASGIAININSSQVTLDLNGHTLTNASTASGSYGIYSGNGFSGVRVTNGSVVGGYYGISLSSSVSGGDYQVDHLRVTGVGAFAISIASPLASSPATHAIVDTVQVVAPAAGVGIALQNVTGSRVVHSMVRGGLYGIRLWTGTGTIVEDNALAENATGIYLTGASKDNAVLRNTVSRGSTDGISLSGASNNLIAFNTISENGTDGIYVNGNNNCLSDNQVSGNSTYGIRLNGANKNSIARNTVSGTTAGQGINLQFTSTGNSLDGNTASGNFSARLVISDAASTGNIYSNNRFAGNGAVNSYSAGNVSAGGNNAGGANF